MSLLESIILGMVQGLTEFLPVSSSGHLVVLQSLLGISAPGVALEVLLHLGTLLSVLWVFREDFKTLFSFVDNREPRRLLVLLLVGTIPTGIMGFLIRMFLKSLFEVSAAVGVMLLATGILLYLIYLKQPGSRNISRMSFGDALWIGISQGIAVLPGISRSGATIAASLGRGLDKETAIKYSFMLSVPAIAGASLLEIAVLVRQGWEHAFGWFYVAGGVSALIFGIVAIKFFIITLKRGKFHYFAFYCWTVGLLILFFLD